MRISDWSSDVCSSDLCSRATGRRMVGSNRKEGRLQKEAQRQQAKIARRAQRRRWQTQVQTPAKPPTRSEEHTSELQSLMRISYAVFCLKKQTQNTKTSKCKRKKNKTQK